MWNSYTVTILTKNLRCFSKKPERNISLLPLSQIIDLSIWKELHIPQRKIMNNSFISTNGTSKTGKSKHITLKARFYTKTKHTPNLIHLARNQNSHPSAKAPGICFDFNDSKSSTHQTVDQFADTFFKLAMNVQAYKRQFVFSLLTSTFYFSIPRIS